MKTSGADGMRQGLKDLLGKVDEALASAARTAVDSADGAVDATRDHARETLERVAGHLRAAEREITSQARSLDRMVRANPWPAIAATGLVAFLVGFLVRRR